MVQPSVDYQRLFDALSVPFAVLDEHLHYVEVNATYERTLMRPRDQMLGHHIWDVFPEEPVVQHQLTKAFEKALAGKAQSIEELPYSIAVPESDGGGTTKIYWSVHATPIPTKVGEPALFGLRVENVTDQVNARELKDTIAGELQHRIGNLFSLVMTVARQTVRNSVSIDNFLDTFTAWIQSLARTHRSLTGGNWNGLTIRALAEQELETYADKHGDRINIDGPDFSLTAVEAQAISMALHELTTNAAKYGALKDDLGRLDVSWKPTNAEGYTLDWHETGLIDLREPASLGFGSMILTRILPSQLNGEATRQFEPTSHRYRLSVSERKHGFEAELG